MRTEKQIVSRSVENQRSYGRHNKKKYITVHQTGNTSRGANAVMHARLQTNLNPRQASWHWQVDDSVAIQSLEHVVSAWHCSDGRGDGNMHSIGIEICINSDGDYVKSVENGARLVAKIMEQEGISISNVKQHADWSTKNCPAQIRAGKSGIDWNRFINKVKRYLNEGKVDVIVSNDSLYRVQVGAFANKKNAEALANELKKKGYPVYLPNASEVPVTGSKPAPAPKPKVYKEGQKVKIKNSASMYVTEENIPSTRKNKSYTIQQLRRNNSEALIKEIFSWVYTKDLQ